MTEIKEMLYELGYSNISEYPKEYRTRPIYRESEIINQQVVEMLVQSKDEDLLAYADFLDSNNTLRDEPMTR